MRSKELVNEGPMAALSGIKSKLTGGTYTGGYNTKMGQQEVAKVAKMAEPNWFKAQAAYTQQGLTPAQLPDQLTAWARKWFETPALPDYKTSTKQQLVTNQGVRSYLQAAAAHQLAPNQQAAPAAPAAPTDDQSTNDAGAMGQMAGQLTKAGAAGPNAMANAPVSKTNTARPGNPNTTQQAAPAPAAPAPAAPPVFKDPAAFKAEWDKFVASKPNYKLIADPALLTALKNMWMRSGGMKAESKKNKRKPV